MTPSTTILSISSWTVKNGPGSPSSSCIRSATPLVPPELQPLETNLPFRFKVTATFGRHARTINVILPSFVVISLHSALKWRFRTGTRPKTSTTLTIVPEETSNWVSFKSPRLVSPTKCNFHAVWFCLLIISVRVQRPIIECKDSPLEPKLEVSTCFEDQFLLPSRLKSPFDIPAPSSSTLTDKQSPS